MAFRGFLKQSTQVTKTIRMIDSTSHWNVGKTGLSAGITKYLGKAGAAPAAATMTTVEVDASNDPGTYSLVFTTSHTDTLGEFHLHLTGAAADATDDWWEVVSYLPGEAATVQSGTGTGQISLSSGLVTLAGVTHTGATIPTVTTLTDLTTTANTEPTSPPASTATIAAKIGWLFALAKNKITQTSTTSTLLANDSSTTIGTSTVADDATTFSRTKWS